MLITIVVITPAENGFEEGISQLRITPVYNDENTCDPVSAGMLNNLYPAGLSSTL